MAYNPSLYNPYGYNYQQLNQISFQPQQPVNDLFFMSKQEIDSYTMYPGSVSRPLFLDDKHCAIKKFDLSGGSTTEWYLMTPVEYSEIADPHDVSVTKADLEEFKTEIMEAINEHSLATVQPAKTSARKSS